MPKKSKPRPFTGPFKEGETKTYELIDTTQGAFALFVDRLYCQKITVYKVDLSEKVDGAFTKFSENIVRL